MSPLLKLCENHLFLDSQYFQVCTCQPVQCISNADLAFDSRVVGCFPLTPKFWKFRWECKWKVAFDLPKQKNSRMNGISWKVLQSSQRKFPNGKCSYLFLLRTSFRPSISEILDGSVRFQAYRVNSDKSNVTNLQQNCLLEICTNWFAHETGTESTATFIIARTSSGKIAGLVLE